jgi:FixJ family two-component response regulator
MTEADLATLRGALAKVATAISEAQPVIDQLLGAVCSPSSDFQRKMITLTPREREVLGHVVKGRMNKQIAHDLGITERTIKVHRGRVMVKLGMSNIADLIRMAERTGL